MARNIIAALDVGSSTVTTVIAERGKDGGNLQILGIGVSPSVGVRKGAVVDLDDAIHAIRQSVAEARRVAGVPVSSVFLAVGGSHISVSSSRGVVAVSRADQEIAPEDVRRVIAAAESFIPKNPNKEVLHMIPREFKVDQEGGIKDPVGMHGVRLEVDALIIECSSPLLKNLFKCVEGAGLRVNDYVFAPIAASEAVLAKRQKELGVILLDVGGATASFMVFEEGTPVHAGVLALGGDHITGDLAIGLRVHPDIAEQVKMAYGACLPDQFSKRDSVRLAEFIPDDNAVHGRRELASIVEARLQDLFELLQKELRKINRVRLLPAGVVLVGGSSLIPGIVSLTKREIGLSADQGVPQGFSPESDVLADPSLAVALGVIRWADSKTEIHSTGWKGHLMHVSRSPVMRWLKSLLP